MRGNTKVMSEMLTEMVPGQEDPSDHELLQVSHLDFFLFTCLKELLKATRGSIGAALC